MIFNYQARTKTGEVQTGRVEARDENAATAVLQSHDLIVTALESVEAEPLYAKRLKIFSQISAKDLAVFSRQLSVLFSADVPLVSALHTLEGQETNEGLREILADIAADVDGGMKFSDALEKYPDIFSNFYVQMVRAGEESGNVEQVLLFLTEYTERRARINSKIRGAMIYPAFVVVTFTIVAIVMLVFVIPQLLNVLAQGGGELPIVTRVIIFLSESVQSFWHIGLVFLSVLLFIIWRYTKTEAGRIFWDEFKLKLPVAGKLFRQLYIFRFAESLNMLLAGGVPINRALSITSDIVDNSVYRKIIIDARAHVNRGESISSALMLYPEVPSLVAQMVSVGEHSGKLTDILGNISDFYEEETNNAVNNLTSLIEPVLMVVIGLAVAVLVIGVLLPIYGNIQTLQ